MSLQAGSRAIAMYFREAWVSAIPVYPDGWAFETVAPSVLLTVKEGAYLQNSVGRVSNVFHQVGTLICSIYTDGGAGSSTWRAIADDLVNIVFAKSLDVDGELLAGSATPLIRFSAPELGEMRLPYIGADTDGVPFRQTNLICPFIRYDLR